MVSCKSTGIDEPVFRYDSPGFWVEFLFAKVLPENKNSDGLGDGLGDSPKEKIITLIKKDDRISITEMSRILKISTTAIETHETKWLDPTSWKPEKRALGDFKIAQLCTDKNTAPARGAVLSSI